MAHLRFYVTASSLLQHLSAEYRHMRMYTQIKRTSKPGGVGGGWAGGGGQSELFVV